MLNLSCFKCNNNFPYKTGFTIFMCLLNQKLSKILGKSNEPILGRTDERTVKASRIKNLVTRFFVYLITCLRSRSCISHFVHLKQSFVHASTLTCNTSCTYYKEKNILEQSINLRSIPLTINPEPSLGIQTIFYRERNNRQVSCLPITKQPHNFCQLCLKVMNMVGPSKYLLV